MGRWFGFSAARWVALATAAVAACAPVVVAGQAYAGSGDPVPAVPVPPAVDVVASYQGQRSCDPAAKPGVEAYARLVLTTYRQGRNGGIVRGCGTGATSEHKEGRAFDWMLSIGVPAEKAAGDALTSLADRAGRHRRRGRQRAPAGRHVPHLEPQDLEHLPGR